MEFATRWFEGWSFEVALLLLTSDSTFETGERKTEQYLRMLESEVIKTRTDSRGPASMLKSLREEEKGVSISLCKMRALSSRK